MDRADVEHHLARAADAVRESAYLDFKESFNPDEPGAWQELIKDLIAMANSGGGVVVIGVKNGGHPASADLSSVLALDPADITNQVTKYVGEPFAEFAVEEVDRSGHRAAAIVVGAAVGAPLVAVRSGTYEAPPGKQRSAFREGAVYVRHGAKSTPAYRQDLRAFLQREIDAVRAAWFAGVTQVMQAPPGTEITAVLRGVDPDGTPTVQLTADPGTPVFGQIDADNVYPYRQKEVIAEVNRALPGVRFNTHDAQAVKTVHDIHPLVHPEFARDPRFGSTQYSEAYVEWLIERIEASDEFLLQARDGLRARRAAVE